MPREREPNMRDPDPHDRTAPETLETLKAIEQATTTVKTGLLARNGIEHLRIISESKFLDLVRQAGCLPTAKGPVSSGSKPSTPRGSGDVCAPEGPEPRGMWSQLRSRHEESVQKIEGRMEKLTRTFQSLQGVFERIEGRRGDPASEQGPLDARGPMDAEKQKTLLRQMLLTGEAP